MRIFIPRGEKCQYQISGKLSNSYFRYCLSAEACFSLSVLLRSFCSTCLLLQHCKCGTFLPANLNQLTTKTYLFIFSVFASIYIHESICVKLTHKHHANSVQVFHSRSVFPHFTPNIMTSVDRWNIQQYHIATLKLSYCSWMENLFRSNFPVPTNKNLQEPLK